MHLHATELLAMLGLHACHLLNCFLQCKIWCTSVFHQRMKQNGACLGAHQKHVFKSFKPNQGQDEESEVDLCLLLIRLVNVTHISDWLALVEVPKKARVTRHKPLKTETVVLWQYLCLTPILLFLTQSLWLKKHDLLTKPCYPCLAVPSPISVQ